MADYTLSKQPLSYEIFNDNWDRKIYKGGKFGDILGVRENWHHGVDYGAEVGEKLHALTDGEVVFVTSRNTKREQDYGRFIGTYYPNWDVTISYAHNSIINIGEGAKVSKGTVIAKSGNTGISTGPHVDVMIAHGRHTTLEGIYQNAFDFETYVPSEGSKPSGDNKYINLKPIESKPRYGYYEMGVVPVAKNISGYLLPYPLDGISYEIKRMQSNNVAVVQTRDFGEVQLYVDSSRATLTDSPEYNVYGEVGNVPLTPPKPSPVKSRVGEVLVVRKGAYSSNKFYAYQDKACTKPYEPWTVDKDLTFGIVEDYDPVFKCVQWSLTPMRGTDHVYIKWEPGIGFDLV
ncbi:MAG: M23 family metallopeptidase [Erysipelothrix sp.]